MRIVRFRDCEPTPWKNGGGETREIAAFPLGASLNAFDWRLSVADVAADSPFSTFPGVERTLALLAGAGMILHIDGAVTRLNGETRVVRFSGEAAVSARLIAGPTRDFNVMTRCAAFAHSLEFAREGELAPPSAAGAVLAVLALEDGVELRGAEGSTRLAALDVALQLAADGALTLTGSAIVVRLVPAPR